MKQADFEKLIFEAAIIAMAVDGEVHKDEKFEIKKIFGELPYFTNLDLDVEMESTLTRIHNQGPEGRIEFLNHIGSAELSLRQKRIIVEVILRVICADQIAERSEVILLHQVVDRLSLHAPELALELPQYIHILTDLRQDLRRSDFQDDAFEL